METFDFRFIPGLSFESLCDIQIKMWTQVH